MKKRIVCLVWTLAVLVFAQELPNNIILMIGDGMGVSQVTAGRIVKGELAMERLETIGLMTTHSADELVTDSAAAVTAMATGTKTRNKALSVSPDGQPLKTVAEFAREQGQAVGLVAACSLTHATPAGFAAHVPSRYMQQQIAEQIVAADFQVLFGGGRAWFLPKPETGAPMQTEADQSSAGYGKQETSVGERTDGKNLLRELRRTMPVAETAEEFDALEDTDSAAALLWTLHPPPAAQRSVSLAEQTIKALEILSRDEDGFFLMVEGSQIDWAGHDRNRQWLLEEMVDFDNAVAAAADFIAVHPDTLLVVTSDHECGGFALHNGSVEERRLDDAGFTRGQHTGTLVPLFASGPGAEIFGGVIDNTDLGRILIDYVNRRPALSAP